MRVSIGMQVRVYYDVEDDVFDDGWVDDVHDGYITVDFLDWLERWPIDRFRLDYLFYEMKEVLVPIGPGEVVIDFRRRDVDAG